MSEKHEIASLGTPMEELEQKIVEETDVDQLKNIINLFNLNIQKKDLLRTSKISDLEDKITKQIEDRLNHHAGEFSNKDLLDYYKVMQDSITRSSNNLQNFETPAIQINQNHVNINVKEDELDRQSKLRVMDAVKAMLAKAGMEPPEDVIDVDVVEEEPIIDESTINEETK